MTRKIYLPSPREPSGATWLINCLLELGIRTYRTSPDGMWRRSRDRWILNPHEELLRKWLPVLSERADFRFREDVEVEWMHEWNSPKYAHSRIIYFVRDPRDALFSRYKREAPQLSFSEFSAFPDVWTLLDKISTWKLFNEGWLCHPHLTVVRFEDYKANANETLRRVLNAIDLEYSEADIDRAVENSTYDRAAEAERRYRDEHPQDTQIINRSGKPMEWQTGAVDEGVIRRIEGTCEHLLERFGYPLSSSEPITVSLNRHCSRLRFFDQLILNRKDFADRDGEYAAEEAFTNVVRFASHLNADLLTRACLPPYELVQLKASLEEYLASVAQHVEFCFSSAAPRADPPIREVMSMERIKRGLFRRARRLIGTGS